MSKKEENKTKNPAKVITKNLVLSTIGLAVSSFALSSLFSAISTTAMMTGVGMSLAGGITAIALIGLAAFSGIKLIKNTYKLIKHGINQRRSKRESTKAQRLESKKAKKDERKKKRQQKKEEKKRLREEKKNSQIQDEQELEVNHNVEQEQDENLEQEFDSNVVVEQEPIIIPPMNPELNVNEEQPTVENQSENMQTGEDFLKNLIADIKNQNLSNEEIIARLEILKVAVIAHQELNQNPLVNDEHDSINLGESLITEPALEETATFGAR